MDAKQNNGRDAAEEPEAYQTYDAWASVLLDVAEKLELAGKDPPKEEPQSGSGEILTG